VNNVLPAVTRIHHSCLFRRAPWGCGLKRPCRSCRLPTPCASSSAAIRAGSRPTISPASTDRVANNTHARMGQEPPAVARDGDGEQWDLPCAACSITGRPLRAPPARRGHCSCSYSYLACRTACAPPACCPPPAPPRSPAPPLSFAPGARSFSFLAAPLCRHARLQPHKCAPMPIADRLG
jgi:hypothetical protein